MKIITNYKGHRITYLDGNSKGRVLVQGPKVNRIFQGGGLSTIAKWL